MHLLAKTFIISLFLFSSSFVMARDFPQDSSRKLLDLINQRKSQSIERQETAKGKDKQEEIQNNEDFIGPPTLGEFNQSLPPVELKKEIFVKKEIADQEDIEINVEEKNPEAMSFKEPIVDEMEAEFLDDIEIQRRIDKFRNLLKREYLKLAERLSKHNNWSDATYFRRKGYEVLDKYQILPENPQDWEIKDDIILDELYKERLKLLKSLTKNTPVIVPNTAAKAVVFYDCWIEQEQNTWKQEEIECQQLYKNVQAYLEQVYDETLLTDVKTLIAQQRTTDVEDKIGPMPAMGADNEPYKGDEYEVAMRDMALKILQREKEAKKRAEEKRRRQGVEEAADGGGFIIDETTEGSDELVFLVYFNQRSAELTNNARQELARVIDSIAENNPSNVIVNGHTDRAVSGSEALILSKQRADVVKQYLQENGVEKPVIRSFGFGNSDNIVENAADEPKAANRRVEIIFRGEAN